ncbi:hypothetical protein [Nocardioides sp.]|uniref:hypothetical protein n=1 Tax=Nocardioides sp. TaxID=35761 RepID=UPI002B957622|nr:hypothetical protein [Nocardioides sp.]HXH77320.1 hypothetical protein [Nocardioides sp.]
MTTWVGTPAQSWTLPVSLDGTKTRGIDESVERDVEQLEAWARPAGDTNEPPPLTVTARVGRGRATARWVITSIDLGEQIRNDEDDRVRQDLTLNLLEYVPGQILKGPGAKARAKGKKNKGDGKTGKSK